MTASSPDVGADAVVKYFNSKPKECPQQKYVIVGYSQGCVVQRRAMVKLDAAVLERIVASITFGDPGLKSSTAPMGGPVPKWPAQIEKRFYTNCATGDPVCDVKSGANILQHLTYLSGDYMAKSAEYVKAHIGS
jgi:cutinase